MQWSQGYGDEAIARRPHDASWTGFSVGPGLLRRKPRPLSVPSNASLVANAGVRSGILRPRRLAYSYTSARENTQGALTIIRPCCSPMSRPPCFYSFLFRVRILGGAIRVNVLRFGASALRTVVRITGVQLPLGMADDQRMHRPSFSYVGLRAWVYLGRAANSTAPIHQLYTMTGRNSQSNHYDARRFYLRAFTLTASHIQSQRGANRTSSPLCRPPSVSLSIAQLDRAERDDGPEEVFA